MDKKNVPQHGDFSTMQKKSRILSRIFEKKILNTPRPKCFGTAKVFILAFMRIILQTKCKGVILNVGHISMFLLE